MRNEDNSECKQLLKFKFDNFEHEYQVPEECIAAHHQLEPGAPPLRSTQDR